MLYIHSVFASMKLPLDSHHVSDFLCCPIWKIHAHISDRIPCFFPVLYMKHTMWKNWFTKANVYLTYLPSLGWTLEYWVMHNNCLIGVWLQLHEPVSFEYDRFYHIYNEISLFWSLMQLVYHRTSTGWVYTIEKMGHLGKVIIWFLPQFFSSSCYPDAKSTSLSATHYHWHRGLHRPFCVSHYQRHRKKILLVYCAHTAAQAVLGKGRWPSSL